MLLLLFASGCTSLMPGAKPEGDSDDSPVIVALPPVVVEPTPQEPPDPPQQDTISNDVPDRSAEPAAVPKPEPLVVVALSDRTPAYLAVANALQAELPRTEVYDLSDPSIQSGEAFQAIHDSGALVIVAVGLQAAEAARVNSHIPVVVTQSFNTTTSPEWPGLTTTVSMLPPIDLQIDYWQTLDPDIKSIGAIVGPGHEALLTKTATSMREHGIEFQHAVAENDRETLYLFNRMASVIDGFLLFPDNRVLSPAVLRDMMRYAEKHNIQVAVFNEPLLKLGAVFSAEAFETDIAATIAQVIEKIELERSDSLPEITELSKIRIRTNPTSLIRFGLSPDAAYSRSAESAR